MNLARIAAVALALAAASPALAQQQRAGGTRIGVGVGLSSLDAAALLSGGATQVYVPLDLGNIRIEPQIGILRLGQDGGGDQSQIDLGAGLLLVQPMGQSFRSTMGGRAVLSFVSQEVDVGVGFADASGTNLKVMGVAGGEYLFGDRFSIGAEAQLGLTFVGDQDIDGGGQIQGGTVFATGAVVFFRAYIL